MTASDSNGGVGLWRQEERRQDWRSLALLTALTLGLFTLRLAAPPNLLDQDQENPAAYVLDALKNGNWICQRDLGGNITSKPPFYTWLVAIGSLALGRISQFTLYLPGALGLLGETWLVFLFGREHFGRKAAMLGALACLLSTAGLKQLGLARTDGVFAFTVTAAALLAYRNWCRGRGWTWFWLVAIAATLTKGPLGVVLASLGLVATKWEQRSGDSLPIRGSHLAGIALFAMVTIGWVVLAYQQLGQPFIDKVFLQELVFHMVERKQRKIPGSSFYLPPLYYVARAAPWSLLALSGFWRIWRHPAVNPAERRFERFLFCWFGGGLFLFSMASHQRGDLLWPILPAGALIAGRELARLTRSIPERRWNGVVALVVALAVAGFSLHYLVLRARQPLIQQTVALRTLARDFEQQAGRDFPLFHTDDPTALQVYLDTCHLPISFARAAELLRGRDKVVVAVTDLGKLQAERHPSDPPLFTLFEDQGPVPRAKVRIVSNRPHL